MPSAHPVGPCVGKEVTTRVDFAPSTGGQVWLSHMES